MSSKRNNDQLSLEYLKDNLTENSLIDLFPESKTEGIKLPHKNKKINPDKYLQKVIEIHFDDTYGSPYWLEQKETLGFDPIQEIKNFDDLLNKFPVSDEEALKERPIEDFIPKLFKKKFKINNQTKEIINPEIFNIAKSSGTTGKKKKMPWSNNITEEIKEWYDYNLDLYNQAGGNWLVCGPYGQYEKDLINAGNVRGGFVFFNGIETKDIKNKSIQLNKIAQNPLKILDSSLLEQALLGAAHMKPTIESIKDDINSQRFNNLASSPFFVASIHELLLRENSQVKPEDIHTILISGASITKETINKLKRLYINAKVIPMYASSIIGPAFDHPETEDIVYYPPKPLVKFNVIKNDGTNKLEEVDYNERGRVVLQRISECFFWPNQTERETGIRKEPKDPFAAEGLSKVRPL